VATPSGASPSTGIPAGTGEAGHLAGARKISLAAKHTASLQLLCTVGGNQARLDARTEFKNFEPSPKGGLKYYIEASISGLPIYTTMAYLSRRAP
jgi:hypothetical protein